MQTKINPNTNRRGDKAFTSIVYTIDDWLLICYNLLHMVQVTRKDEREANENVIRRFNRKVLQSGVLSTAKASMRFAKPISKTERRNKAIIRKARKADKMAKMRLGVR
jgi:ribosomal protein S21